MPKIEVNETDALQRYLQLTAIPGGSGNEKDVAQAIVDTLLAAGLSPDHVQYDDAHTKTRIAGNCGNLIVDLPGNGNGPRTMLSAHMDTVPICLGSTPRVDGDEVVSDGNTGLGADDRSGCAAILSAAVERLKAGDQNFPPAVLGFFIQEEVGLEGARHLDAEKLGVVDRAFNFDGGPLDKVTVGAIGGERIEIELTGVPSHAGVAPEKGASAIVMASKAIADLHASGWHGRVENEFGVGTSNVGVIQGGDATNVVTPQVKLRAEARSHDSAMRTKIVAAIKAAFESAAADVQTESGVAGKLRFESRVDYEAFRLPENDPSVVALENALRSMGREPFQQVAGGGLDANWLNLHGVAAVTVGCGQRNIHTADERLDIRDYQGACQVAANMICESH